LPEEFPGFHDGVYAGHNGFCGVSGSDFPGESFHVWVGKADASAGRSNECVAVDSGEVYKRQVEGVAFLAGASFLDPQRPPEVAFRYFHPVYADVAAVNADAEACQRAYDQSKDPRYLYQAGNVYAGYVFSDSILVALVDRETCVACGKCVDACPKKLIDLVPYETFTFVQCNSQDKGKAVKEVCEVGCIACTMCVKACEDDAIHMNGNVALIDYSKCINCGKCAAKCPTKVIQVVDGKIAMTA